ncbi:MAG: putative porin [Bacteroidales bacterium]|nr:putative porin [Bacteroidales bacterium]
MVRSTAFFIVLLVLSRLVQAGMPEDTLKSRLDIPWYTEEQLQSPFEATPNFVDTTITGFQHYDFAHRAGFFFANKGNVGHATRQLQFSPVLGHDFPLDGGGLFQGYRLEHSQLRFYRPKHVFTDLFYVTGSEREQLFYALHNQKFHETLHAGFNYQLVNSPGFYNRVASRNSNIYLTLDFQLPNKRYQALASFISNRFSNQESGGLENYLDFEEDPNRDIVFLPQAELRHRETAVNLHHFYQTGFYVGGSGDDTLSDRRFINLGRINHEFSWKRQTIVFNDPSPPVEFYEVEPFNPASTFDSTIVNTLENLLSWSNFPLQSGRGTFPFNFKIYIKHRLIDIRQPLYEVSEPGEGEETSDPAYVFREESFNQVVQGVELESDQTRFLSGKAFAHLTLGGYNDEDLGIGANLALGRPEQKHRLFLNAAFYQQEAPYFLSRFYGNYISWENDFDKQQIGHAQAKYQSKWLSLEGNYYLLSNIVFMGPEALPVQNTGTFGLLSAGIGLKAGIGVFQTRHKVLYQYTGEQQFEQFPELVSYHSVFFDFSLFKKAMDLNLGFDLFYNAPYRPMAYMPVVRQFYAQDSYERDPVLLVDAFATIKVQRTRFFIKAQNLGSLLPDAPVIYAIPFYPLPEMAIKFGLSWMFFD